MTPCSASGRGAIAAGPALAADAPATARALAIAPCTTSAACCATGRASCWWRIPGTTATAANATSAPTCRIWRPPAATTPGGSSPWPCAWWSRMGCPTASPPGTCGATTASSSPSPRCRTGSRPRGKKGIQQTEGEYLDEALAGFSGCLAVDELYDGPFCVLSAVDPHQQRRLLYEGLDH